MSRFEKQKGLSLKKADAAADIGLINKYSVKELTPEDVYCFSLILCDNDVDRDYERFTDATLEKLAELFVGKTGISDHKWNADRQIARLYHVEVETTNEKNALGEPLCLLCGRAYMLRTESNQPIIEAIEGGIMKEISIGCAIAKTSCSICGNPFQWDWRTGVLECTNSHIKGEQYEEGLCICNLEEPTDAYEFSFVAVPAQKGAGVTKAFNNIDEAFEMLMRANLSEHSDKVKELLPHMQFALTDAAERMERAKILAENKQYLKSKELKG